MTIQINKDKRIQTYTETTAPELFVVVVGRVIETVAPGRRALRWIKHIAVAINSLN